MTLALVIAFNVALAWLAWTLLRTLWQAARFLFVCVAFVLEPLSWPKEEKR